MTKRHSLLLKFIYFQVLEFKQCKDITLLLFLQLLML